jgi:hypothetical protein
MTDDGAVSRALVLALALALGLSPDARAQDAGCVPTDPTMGCPRTTPLTAREVRAHLGYAARSIRRCAWEFLEGHAPASITVTVPGTYTQGDPLTVAPTTFGAPPLAEQRFAECVAYYASPSLPYAGPPITRHLDLRMPRPLATVTRSVTALLAAHRTEIDACWDAGAPARALFVTVDADGTLQLFGLRTDAAPFDSSRANPLGCAGYRIGRLSIAHPPREVGVEVPWPPP